MIVYDVLLFNSGCTWHIKTWYILHQKWQSKKLDFLILIIEFHRKTILTSLILFVTSTQHSTSHNIQLTLLWYSRARESSDLLTTYIIETWYFSNNIHFRPHHSTMYVHVAYCYRRRKVVCPATMAEPTKMLFGLLNWVGPTNHVLHGGPYQPYKAAVLWRKGAVHKIHCKVWAVQNRMNWSRCHLGYGLRWAQGSKC